MLVDKVAESVRDPSRTAPRKVLNRREAAIFVALTDACCGPGGVLPPVVQTDAVDFIGELISASPRINRVGFRVLLRMLDLAPFARGYRRRFRRLGGDERDQFLHGLDKSRFLVLRIAARLFKTLAIMSYYGDNHVLIATGYDADANIARARELRAREGRL